MLGRTGFTVSRESAREGDGRGESQELPSHPIASGHPFSLSSLTEGHQPYCRHLLHELKRNLRKSCEHFGFVMPSVRVPKTERIRRPQQCKSINGFIASLS